MAVKAAPAAPCARPHSGRRICRRDRNGSTSSSARASLPTSATGASSHQDRPRRRAIGRRNCAAASAQNPHVRLPGAAFGIPAPGATVGMWSPRLIREFWGSRAYVCAGAQRRGAPRSGRARSGRPRQGA